MEGNDEPNGSRMRKFAAALDALLGDHGDVEQAYRALQRPDNEWFRLIAEASWNERSPRSQRMDPVRLARKRQKHLAASLAIKTYKYLADKGSAYAIDLAIAMDAKQPVINAVLDRLERCAVIECWNGLWYTAISIPAPATDPRMELQEAAVAGAGA